MNIDQVSLEKVAAQHAAAMALPDSAWLASVEAAAFLSALGQPVAPKTLERWRCVRSDGPAYRRVGRYVTYKASDLRAFAAARERAARAK